jgi:hypothetical protein
MVSFFRLWYSSSILLCAVALLVGSHGAARGHGLGSQLLKGHKMIICIGHGVDTDV